MKSCVTDRPGTIASKPQSVAASRAKALCSMISIGSVGRGCGRRLPDSDGIRFDKSRIFLVSVVSPIPPLDCNDEHEGSWTSDHNFLLASVVRKIVELKCDLEATIDRRVQ